MTTPNATPKRRQLQMRFATVLLAASLMTAIAVYARVLSGEFQFDDENNIERNLEVKDMGRFAHPGAWSFSMRPLTKLSFAMNYRIGRLDTFGYHATNLAIHLATAALLFLLGRRALTAAGLAAPEACAAAAASLFALHPLQTESVSYLVQRSEALASLLYVAALLLLVETERAKEARWRALLVSGALAAAAAALAAKQVAATLPLACLLFWQVFSAAESPGRRLGRRLLLGAPFFALSFVATWKGLHGASGSSHSGFEIPGLGPVEYLLTQGRVVFRYLSLLVFPVGQNVDPDVGVSRSLFEPATFAAGLGVLAVVGASFGLLWRRPAPPPTRASRVGRVAAFGALWFVLLLLPSSLVPLADVMAEHRTYLANWGLLLAVVTAAHEVGESFELSPASRVAALAAVLTLLAAATWSRNRVWETRVALWSDATAKSPAKPRPFANLGWALALQRNHAEAIGAYQRALGLNPDEHLRAEILRNLGSSLAQQGRHHEAATALTEAALDPDIEADARSLLAMSLVELRVIDAARAQVTRALQINPNHGAARNTLGQVFLAERNPPAALEQFRIAVRLNPDNVPPRVNVALSLELLGRFDEACVAWREYLVIEKAPAGLARGASRLNALRCGDAR